MKAFQKSVNYLFLVLIVLVVVLPFLWVLSSSFKSETEIMSGRTYLPRKFTLENYANLLTEYTSSKHYPRNLFNSLVVGLGSAVCTVVVAILAAYSLSRYRNKVSDAIAQTLIFIYVFPTIVVIVPLFKFFSGIGLVDSFMGLIVINTAFFLPFCIWLLRSFFNSVPISFEEAALLDGATYFQAFFRTTLPLAAPGIATATIYTFIMSWGEYLFASIFIISDHKKTVPLGLATYMADQYIEWGKLLAGGVIVIIPVLILFYPLSRYFIRGFISGIKE
ncbi:MAG: carbohydrate ABC transporter permease [Spirochaetaceae bacterium]|nr:MAG: carbohydrate ABC transporter permease [Spirochaetaceae bacterium]